jgi:hypothetical protein
MLYQGTIEFTYSVADPENAFIMTTEQYYGYKSISGYTGSLDAGLDSKSGTLTCKIETSDMYYFIIANEQYYSTVILSYDIKLTVKQTLLESLR